MCVCVWGGGWGGVEARVLTPGALAVDVGRDVVHQHLKVPELIQREKKKKGNKERREGHRIIHPKQPGRKKKWNGIIHPLQDRPRRPERDDHDGG